LEGSRAIVAHSRRRSIFVALLAASCLALAVGASPAFADEPTPTRFVAFGDSLTFGYKNPGPSWPVELDAMRGDLVLVHNAGIPGDTTKDMLARIDRDVYAYSPELLFVFAGINDLSECRSVDQVVQNIKAIVAGAYAHGTTQIVLILNAHTRSLNAQKGHACGPSLQRNITLLDDALLAYGRSAGIQTIDLRPVLDTGGKYTPEFFVSDGVHFNANGVNAVCAAIDAQLYDGDDPYERYLRGPR